MYETSPFKHRGGFARGMLVRYVGETAHHGAGRRIVRGGIYTVAGSQNDGANQWLTVQEMPGVRHCASRFEHTHHLAEDHWVVDGVEEARPRAV